MLSKLKLKLPIDLLIVVMANILWYADFNIIRRIKCGDKFVLVFYGYCPYLIIKYKNLNMLLL